MTLDRAGYYRDTIFSKHFETHFISLYLRYLQEKIELEIRKRCSIDDYLKAIANNIKAEMEELKSEISDESNVSDIEVLT